MFKLKWILNLLSVFAQKGGMWISKIFSSTLITIWTRNANKEKQCQTRVVMPASTRIITAREINKKLNDFDKRLSLVDAGTDAYLGIISDKMIV